jgi:addiction module HigA family antidote
MEDRIPPIHPGEILKHDFLGDMAISEYRLAKDIHVPPRRINEITHGTRNISADTALRLDRYFGMSDGYWMGLQSRYLLECERDRLSDELASITPRAS